MKNYKLHQIATFAFALLLSTTTWAAPASTTAYGTDPQNTYVADATSSGISQLNMVLCIINSMNISGSGMVNKGAYVALVDMNKCQSKGGTGGSTGGASGSGSSKNYMTAVINATRASNTVPMVADVWMSMTEQGQVTTVYAKLTATSSPTDVPPYGVFRMDYVGYAQGGATPMFNGYINATTTDIQQYESDAAQGQGSVASTVALAMTAGSTTSGSGTMAQTGNTAAKFNFNYNSTNFRRSDGTHDQCFDRAAANADKSVWQYGTYDNTTGARVDLTNPSFQIQATKGGSSYFGFASYYGIGFQGLDLNSIADAAPISGLTITDQRPGKSTTYSLNKVSGKLTKWTRNKTTLTALDGIPFSFNGDLTSKTNDTTGVVTGFKNWQVQWNNTAGNFTVVGVQSCGNNGCALQGLGTNATPAATAITVNAAAFNNLAISGWSDSFGGSINIPFTGAVHGGSDEVDYYSQSLVIPGSTGAPTALTCLSNCPDAASVTSVNGSGTAPFNSGTSSQWFSGPNTISYTFDAGGLKNAGTAMIVTNANFFKNNSQYSNGVMTGNLFDPSTADAIAACVAPNNTSWQCEPKAPSVYYTWTTGTNQWSQSLWLTNGSTVVAFDPPQNIAYTVPSTDVPSGSSWSGKAIQLQFNGFGNLQGIPGHCVSPVDNSPADCMTSNVRYVPEFAIADGETMALGSTTLIVKALNEEIRLKDLGAGAAACSAMALTPLTLPDATGLHNVSLSTDAYYIGTEPTPASSIPKVIDGVVQ